MSPEAPLSLTSDRKESNGRTPRPAVRDTKQKSQRHSTPVSRHALTGQLFLKPEASEITFLRLPQVKATTGLSKTTIYEKIKDNAFPCPVLISKRAVAWIESEVRQWAASQVSAARKVSTPMPPKRVAFSRPRLPVAKTA